MTAIKVALASITWSEEEKTFENILRFTILDLNNNFIYVYI